jgi:hypothetical protein
MLAMLFADAFRAALEAFMPDKAIEEMEVM